MSFRYHGNYCGPGWSAGKYQKSVRSRVAALDEFDETCKDHDGAYAGGIGLKAADRLFYKRNIGKGFKRSAAAIAVGVQGYFRAPDSQSGVVSKSSGMAPAGRRSKSRSRGRSAYRTPRTAPRRRISSRSRSGNGVRPMSISSRASSASVAVRGNPFRSRSRSVVRFRPGSTSGGVGLGGTGLGTRPRNFNKPNAMKYRGCNTFVKEIGSTVESTDQVIYLGHTTHASLLVREVAWGALFNRLMEKASYFPTTPESSGYATLAGDKFVVSYRTVDEAAIPGSIIEIWTPGAGVITQLTFVAWAMAAARPWNSTVGGEICFQRIYVECPVYNPQFRSLAEVCMFKLKINLQSKSAMKFQNRSISTSGNQEEDSIDNVPLYGKWYGGNGTGSRHTFQSSVGAFPFTADQTTGIIFTPSSTGTEEPPYPAEFTKIQLAGSFSLPPGVVKTSVISSGGTHAWDQLFKGTNPFPATAGVKAFTPMGKFKFFGVEKIMNVNAEVPMVVSYEVQTTIMAAVQEGHNNVQTSNFYSAIV